MALTFTPIDDSNNGSNLTFTPIDDSSHIGEHALEDLKGIGAGAAALAKTAVRAPMDAAQTAMERIQGVPYSETPVGQSVANTMQVVKGALPHQDADGSLNAGGILNTAKQYITHPADSFVAHPIDMPLDVINTILPAWSALKGADVAKAAEVAGDAAQVAEPVGAAPSVGAGKRFLSATSGAAPGSFEQLNKDADLLKTAPKVSDAVSMAQTAATKDLPALLDKPTSAIASDLKNGLGQVKQQYYGAIDSTAQSVAQHLDALKQAASDAEASVRDKLGIGESQQDTLNNIAKNGTNAMKPDQIINEHTLVSKFNDAEPQKLKALLNLRQNLDANLDFIAANKQIAPTVSKNEAALMKLRGTISDQIHSLPGGQEIQAVDNQWHDVMDARRSLMNKFGTEDKATKAVEGLVNNERPSKETMAGLQKLEQLTGKPIVQPLLDTAKPLQDTMDALEPHMATPDTMQQFIHNAAVGNVDSSKLAALQHIDQVAGTQIVPKTQQISHLVDLKNSLGDRFMEPGKAEETLRMAFNDPAKHKDLITAIQQLEQSTGKPIGTTVNRALGADALRAPINTSKGTMALRVGAGAGAGVMAMNPHMLPLVGAIAPAISPRLLATGFSAGAKGAAAASSMGEKAAEVAEKMHLMSLGQSLEAGRIEDEAKKSPFQRPKGK